MTRQYRVTTQNIFNTDREDCLLPEDDPIHQLKIASMLGGIGAQAKLAEYNNITYDRIRDKNEQDYRAAFGMTKEEAIRAGHKPGTAAWHALFQHREVQPKKQRTKSDLSKIVSVTKTSE